MFKSRGLDPIGVCLARIAAPAALAAGIAVITVWALDRLNARDLATEARAIENRAFTLRVQAVTSGSLACLEAATDAMLREPCEKAVFSSAESTAAAVSYVAAQLSVLSAGGEHVRDGSVSHLTEIATLRRAIESRSIRHRSPRACDAHRLPSGRMRFFCSPGRQQPSQRQSGGASVRWSCQEPHGGLVEWRWGFAADLADIGGRAARDQAIFSIGVLDSQHQYHGLRAGYSCCVTAAAVTGAA